MKTTHKINDLGFGYKVKMVSNPDGGLPTCTYFYKRHKVGHKILNSGMARQMRGYYMIAVDLQKVRKWLEEISSRLEESGESAVSSYFPKQINLSTCSPIVSGLYVAALTIYGKCFTSTKAEGRRVKLEKKIFDDHESKSSQYLNSHEYFMHLRHNLAAHSGSTSLERTEVIFALPPKSKPKIWPMVFNIGMQIQTALPSNMEADDGSPSFGELVEYVETWISNKVNLLEKKIWVEEMEKLVKNEHNTDPEMLARVKSIVAEWRSGEKLNIQAS